MQKIFLNCPFDDKEECKSLGGKWDAESRSWFITSNLDIEKFEKWIVPGAIAKANDSEDNGRTYLNVPFDEKEACKEMGGYWEQKKRWFLRKVWPFKTKSGCEESVSKMRPTCKSHTDERLAKGECCQTKESSSTRSGR